MLCTELYAEQLAEEEIELGDMMTWVCPDTSDLVVLNDASKGNIEGINFVAYVVQC